MQYASWVQIPHLTFKTSDSEGGKADLAQVAFGQTKTFNLRTWLEHPMDWRSHFRGKVPGSSPGVGTIAVLAQLVERQTFNLVAQGSSP